MEFEVDAKVVSDAIKDNRLDISEFGSIIRASHQILQQEPMFLVKFIRRQANVVAHELAREALSYASPTSWVYPSVFISHVLALTCNCTAVFN